MLTIVADTRHNLPNLSLLQRVEISQELNFRRDVSRFSFSPFSSLFFIFVFHDTRDTCTSKFLLLPLRPSSFFLSFFFSSPFQFSQFSIPIHRIENSGNSCKSIRKPSYRIAFENLNSVDSIRRMQIR